MLKRVLAHYAGGLCAGTLIAIGGGVFLGCRSMGNVGQVAGAVFFTVALSALFLGLAGNLSATMLWGLAVRYAIPSTAEAADAVAAAKLTQSFPQTLLRATLCGVLMYLAVTVWRDRSKVVAILFCVPAFILAGFEHSIADFFYFSAAAEFSGQMWLFTLAALLGNSVGAMLLPLLASVGKGRRAA